MQPRQRARLARRPAIWMAACALALTATTAAAQTPEPAAPTRAAQLAAERDAQKADVAPPQRTVVERALYWYDNQDVLARIVAGWHGFHAIGGRFPAGAGTALGVGYTVGGDTGPGVEAELAGSTSGYKRGGVTFGVKRLGGAPVDLAVHGQAYEYPQEDFFGIGANSRKDDRSNYLLSSSEAGGTVTWRPRMWFAADGGVTYLSPRIGRGTDTRTPSTDVRFDPATLPGYTDTTNYVRTGAGVTVDRRDNPSHPHAGGRVSARVADYRDADSGGFQRAEFDVQHYVPIPDRYRTLALRAAAVFSDPNQGSEVPFYWQPTLGGANALRGFREFRFQDRNSVVVSAEYRWEAWWALDGAFFVDAGTVAPRARGLSMRDVEVSYGAGLRLHSNTAFAARLDFAFSREGFIPLLRFEHVF